MTVLESGTEETALSSDLRRMRSLFNQQRFSPDASRVILVRAFGGSNCMLWFSISGSSFISDASRVWSRYVPSEFSSCVPPYRVRPTRLRKCVLSPQTGSSDWVEIVFVSFLFWGKEGSIRFLHLYFADYQNRGSPHNSVLYEPWWKHLRTDNYRMVILVVDILCSSRKSDAHANPWARERIYFVTDDFFVMTTERSLYVWRHHENSFCVLICDSLHVFCSSTKTLVCYT